MSIWLKHIDICNNHIFITLFTPRTPTRAMSAKKQYEDFWKPVLMKLKCHHNANELPPRRTFQPGAKHDNAWTYHILRVFRGKQKMSEAKKQKSKMKVTAKGPEFHIRKQGCVYKRRCVEVDACSAYPTCCLALDSADNEELRDIQTIVRAFLELRDQAKEQGDLVKVQGFKEAANTFLGCLAHASPVVRNMYVDRLKEEMELACQVIDADSTLLRIAVVSDSVIFALKDETKDITDTQVEGVVNRINEVSICKFALDKDYTNLLTLNKQTHFGLSRKDHNLVLERGIMGKKCKLTSEVAITYLTNLMKHVIRTRTEDGYNKSIAQALGENNVTELMKANGDEKEVHLFTDKQRALERACEMKAGDHGNGDGVNRKAKRRKTDGGPSRNDAKEAGSQIARLVHALARQWGVECHIF